MLTLRAMPGGIHHSVVVVRDLEASLRFYRDGLGLDLLHERHVEGDWPELFDGPSRPLRAVCIPAVPTSVSSRLHKSPIGGLRHSREGNGASRARHPLTPAAARIPTRVAARSQLVTRQCRAGERLDELGHGYAASEECSLTVGPSPLIVETVQQPDDAVGIATIAECHADMIKKAGPEAACTDGLPCERVDSGSGEPVPCRGGKGRVDPRCRCHLRPLASLRQGGRDEGADQPGQ